MLYTFTEHSVYFNDAGELRHGRYTRENESIRGVMRARIREIKALVQAASPRSPSYSYTTPGTRADGGRSNISPHSRGEAMTDDQATRGRRSNHAVYSAEVAMTICDRLVDGQSLRAICSDAGMPGRATVFRWITRHKEFPRLVHTRTRVSGRRLRRGNVRDRPRH